VLRKILLWDWLRGRRGKSRQAGALVAYVFVALVIIGAAAGSSSRNKTSSTTAAAPTQSSSKAPTATTADSTTRTSATSIPESRPKKRPAKKRTVVTTPAPSPAVAAPNPKPVLACISGSNYGGIGASVSAFKSQNPTAGSPPPPSFQDGVAYYELKATKHGCVSEYTITESTTPTQSSRDLLSLVAGIGLPNDAQVLLNQNSCEVWSSASLKQATGEPYAIGYVEVPPEGDATGIVDMSVSSSSHC